MIEAATFLEALQIVGPAVAVYAGIRVDLAAMRVRLDHLERDLYSDHPHHHKEHHHET